MRAGKDSLRGDPAVIGKTLRIGGQPITVIGVLPPGMRFPQIALAPKIAFQETARDALLFQPLAPSERDLNADMGNFNYKAIARLKPGVTWPRRTPNWRLCRRHTRFPHICPFISESRSRH